MNLFRNVSRVCGVMLILSVAVWSTGCADQKTGDKTGAKTAAKTGGKTEAKTGAKTGEQPEAGSSTNDGQTKLPSDQ